MKVALQDASTPECLAECFEKEDKDEVVKQHKTRFFRVTCEVSAPLVSTKDNSYRDKQEKRCQKKKK